MKDTTLPTLREYIDRKAGEERGFEDSFWDIVEYNDFVEQPLELWMFIPCKDGEPLEEPDGFHADHYDDLHVTDQKIWLEYLQALDRTFIKWNDTREQLDIILRENNTIGDLCGKVKLTDKKYIELGL